jgi:hypothetical protein
VTIAEHDKDRGTRQKIDEPDTPRAAGAGPPRARPDARAASPLSAVFRSCRPILGRAISTRSGLDVSMHVPERARAQRTR